MLHGGEIRGFDGHGRSKAITVTGTLINDVDYKTNTLINVFAIIEPFAKVLMEAGEQILLQAGFEVKSGAGFEANNQDCKTNSEAGNKNR
jgi:hypothetical protein